MANRELPQPGMEAETVQVEVAVPRQGGGDPVLTSGDLTLHELPAALAAAAAGKSWHGHFFAFGPGAYYLRVKNLKYTQALYLRSQEGS